jgi:hypothetical protein
MSIDSKHQNDDIVLDDSERQPCEIWTRVMGYHRRVEDFNIGKQSEHRERKHFLEDKDLCNCKTSD